MAVGIWQKKSGNKFFWLLFSMYDALWLIPSSSLCYLRCHTSMTLTKPHFHDPNQATFRCGPPRPLACCYTDNPVTPTSTFQCQNTTLPLWQNAKIITRFSYNDSSTTPIITTILLPLSPLFHCLHDHSTTLEQYLILPLLLPFHGRTSSKLVPLNVEYYYLCQCFRYATAFASRNIITPCGI